MSGGMPELGSKISLISKADIRYEGRLYTVDPQECTIALSSVRSFGTEDRDTQFQIAPQSQIYDYILFRGSDIKDIRVVNNSMPHPQDPAIMQVQLPNGQHLMHFNMPNMNATHAPPMSSGGYPSPFAGMGGLGGIGGAPVTETSSSLAPGGPGGFMMGNQQQSQQQQQQQQAQQKPTQQQQQQKQPISVMDMLAGASRSTTPISLISRKSPSNELGLAGLNADHQQQQLLQGNQQQHQSNMNNAGLGGNSRDAGHKRQNHQQQHPQQQRGGINNTQRNGSGGATDYYQQQQAQRNRREMGARMDSYNNQHEGRNSNYNNARNNHQGSGGGSGGGQGRGWLMHRGGPNNTNMMRNHRGGPGRGGRMPNQDYRPMGGNFNMISKNRQRMKPLKFDIDFDFEQANNKFEELRSQLTKLKVAEDGKPEQCTTPTPSQMNGETDKKDDSGNETGAGEHEPEEEDVSIGYDKTKSFFDNISCEAAQDRTKNKKVDWRQERKLNTQTFGVSTSWHSHYNNRHPSMMNSNGNYRKPGFDYYNNRNYRNNNRMNNNPRMNMNRHNPNNKRGGGTRSSGDGMPRLNNNANNNTDNETDATILKNQAQQQHESNDLASTSATNASPATKSTTQESTPQPQVAAVGAQ